MKKFLFLIFTFSIFSATAQVDAPPTDNSPYSRLGLGDFINNNFAANGAMGNLSAAYHNPYLLNVLNPAASSQLVSTAYEVGIGTRFSKLKDNKDKTASTTNVNIDYLALGFPLKNQINEIFDRRKKSDYKLGMHLALLPYTNVGYDVKLERSVPNVDTATYQYLGSGGTYKLLWGNSIAYKGFSIGANLGYLFGRIKSDRQVIFNSLKDNYEVQVIDGTRYKGFVWSLGSQYIYEFKSKNKAGKLEPNGKKITIGMYGNSPNNINSVSDATYARTNYSYVVGNTSIARDSVLRQSKGVEGNVKLPAEFSVGATYQKGNKFLAGINYTTAKWSSYENDAQPEKMSDAYRLGVGVEYTPDIASYDKYRKRIRYRFGLNTWSDPRTVNGNQLKGQSVSIGFGMPLVMPRQQVSFVNITLEAGKSGTDALMQDFFKTTIGFTLNDNSWFYKRRYN
jgi:tetrahydromethanopterin S-methyltransferase subunit F